MKSNYFFVLLNDWFGCPQFSADQLRIVATFLQVSDNKKRKSKANIFLFARIKKCYTTVHHIVYFLSQIVFT